MPSGPDSRIAGSLWGTPRLSPEGGHLPAGRGSRSGCGSDQEGAHPPCPCPARPICRQARRGGWEREMGVLGRGTRADLGCWDAQHGASADEVEVSDAVALRDAPHADTISHADPVEAFTPGDGVIGYAGTARCIRGTLPGTAGAGWQRRVGIGYCQHLPRGDPVGIRDPVV